MRVTVLGRSPARPNPGEACAGYIVEGGRSRVMLDAGPGTVAQLLRRNTPDELDAVVISHMHTDHCLDLVTLRYSYPWIDVAKKRLLVIVPPGSMAQISELALGAGYVNFFDKSFIFDEHDGKRPIEIGDLQDFLPFGDGLALRDGRLPAAAAPTGLWRNVINDQSVGGRRAERIFDRQRHRNARLLLAAFSYDVHDRLVARHRGVHPRVLRRCKTHPKPAGC